MCRILERVCSNFICKIEIKVIRRIPAIIIVNQDKIPNNSLNWHSHLRLFNLTSFTLSGLFSFPQKEKNVKLNPNQNRKISLSLNFGCFSADKIVENKNTTSSPPT